MVDNKSDREGGFSFPEGVARDCLVSVKQTTHTRKTNQPSAVMKTHLNKTNVIGQHWSRLVGK